MNFAIPRKTNFEILLYIWKIIDLPFITYSDFLYRITFDLFILEPENAKNFINNCIEHKFLIKDNDLLKLSKELEQEINNWQKKRENEIIGKISAAKKIDKLKNDISKKVSTNFSNLVNAFVDKGTLNRSVSVSDAAFELLTYDTNQGILNSKVKGSKEESYVIEIDTNKKILFHNCLDFRKNRANDKKFCKHITKLFLMLREKDEDIAEFFLRDLAKNIDKWDFSA
ncbi:MAG: hypothetical protein ACFFG0_45425 [Candidatus Thorarchaeota archaeon]